MKYLLNVGCGAPGGGGVPAWFENFREVRMDIDPGVAPDILGDITDMSAVADGVVDALWTAHCLEHLYQHQLPRALAEIRRVLTDDGFGCLVVPDLQRIAEYVAQDRMHETVYESPAGPITAHDIFFGHGPALARGHLTMAHRCGFTPTLMVNALNQAGFGGYAVLRRPGFELVAVVRRRDWGKAGEREALLATLGL